MIRKAKALGFATVVVLAVSAVGASGAQAFTNFTCETTAATCKVTIEQHPADGAALNKQKFTTDNGAIVCEKFMAESMGNVTEPTVTLTNISYTECTAFGLEGATVNFEGTPGTPCHYTANVNGNVSIGPAGCSVTITIPGCTTTVSGGQTFTGALTYTNVQTSGQQMEVTIHAETGEAIHYSWSGAACPVGSSGSDTNGKYKGTLTARAFKTDGTPIGLTMS
jgi:hypothetical protein